MNRKYEINRDKIELFANNFNLLCKLFEPSYGKIPLIGFNTEEYLKSLFFACAICHNIN